MGELEGVFGCLVWFDLDWGGPLRFFFVTRLTL